MSSRPNLTLALPGDAAVGAGPGTASAPRLSADPSATAVLRGSCFEDQTVSTNFGVGGGQGRLKC